jgi:hypothetical protein
MAICESMWQNMRAYQAIRNKPYPYIDAEVLLLSAQYSFIHNLQIKYFRTHVDLNIFLVMVCGTRTQNLSATFSYTLYTKRLLI